MMIQPNDYLERLAQADPAARRAALEEALADAGLTPTIQACEADDKHRVAAQNYLLPDPEDRLCPLLMAHYDAHPGSTGANDNAAGVSILIALAAAIKEQNIPADIAFMDGEENGHTGAKLYNEQRTGKNSVVVNLDMCGYGDTLAVYARGSENRSGARVFCDKERLAAHGGMLVPYMPEGDDVCFTTRQQPVLSIAMMPRWDTKYLEAMAAQGSGILGRTPEFQMMTGQMEVATTMHGGSRDDIKYVQTEAMQRVYEYLLDALTAPPQKKKFIFF